MNKLLSIAILTILALTGSPLLAEHGSLFGAELKHVLYFPHFGNGDLFEGEPRGSTTSELVLLVTGAEAHPLIHFTDMKGEVISADSIVEITESLMLLEDGGLTTVDPVPSSGEITVSTTGVGETVQGSVKVLSATSIEGFLRFILPQGIAGVASARLGHNFIAPVQRTEGGINTGLAIHNPGDGILRVDCTLMKDGQELESADIDLAANNQVAQFIDELFTESDTSDFLGSVSCSASSRVTAVALELDFLSGATGVFTTLPVISRVSGADFFPSSQ